MTKKTKPKVEDFYFMRDKETQEFFIVFKQFWMENERIDDSSFGRLLDDILPQGFTESQESTYQYHETGLSGNKCFKIGQAKLLEAGFTEMPNPWE